METVKKFLDAKKSRSRERLQTFVNLCLGEPFEDSGITVQVEGLQARAESYGDEIQVPAGALVLTAGVDVQDDRLEAEIVGWGPGYESWGIEYKVFNGDTKEIGPVGPWGELDKWLQTGWARPSGFILSPSWVLVDSGGHRTTEVYKFCKARAMRKIFASKGLGGPKQFINRPTKTSAVETLLYTLGVDEAKTNLYSALLLEETGAQFCHFPTGRGYDSDFFKQLTAEHRISRYKMGKQTFIWEKKRGFPRNEALDIRILNMASVQLLNVNFTRLAENIKWQDEQQANQRGAETNKNEQGPTIHKLKKRGGGWVNRY